MSDSEEEQVKHAPIIKPHQKQQKDFYPEQLQANEEADSQAPLLVVVQGSKGVGKQNDKIFSQTLYWIEDKEISWTSDSSFKQITSSDIY